MRRALLFCVAIAFAIACGDDLTEPISDPTALTPPRVAFATTTTENGLTISTDKDDYAPGETVRFTGSGWLPGDVLDIVLTDDPLTHDPHRWSVNVAEDGTFQDATYVVDEGDLNVKFTLTATSRATGQSLTVTFTDGNVRVNGTPIGASFDLGVESFGTPQAANQNCSGNPPSVTVTVTAVSGNGQNVGGINDNQSIRLTAPLTSTSGGPFLSWDASTTANPYTTIDARTICVRGFQNGSQDYRANYTAVPDLRITKTGPASVNGGSNVTYTLAVANVGQLATVNPVTVTDDIDASLTLVSAVGLGWTCPLADPVICTRSDTRAAGQSFDNITIVATTTNASATVNNTATVAMTGDLNAANNTSTVSTTVAGTPDLTIDKSHVGNFTHGANEQYKLTVDNAGSGVTTSAVTVTDTLPAGLTFVPPSAGAGWNACTAAGQVVTCQRPVANPINPGVPAPDILLTVNVATGSFTSVTNRARVSGGGEAAVSTVTCTLATNCDEDAATVVNANTAPVANNDAYSVDEDNTLTKNAADGVLKNDTDADNNALTAAIVSIPDPNKTQSFTFNADGSFDFTPKPDFNGPVTFTYKASDGIAQSNTATVTITVVSVNDAPSFTKGPDQTVFEDAGAKSVANWATNIKAGPDNESGQALSITLTNNNNALFVAQPSLSPAGTLTYTPADNAFGSALVTVKLNDDGGTANGGVDESSQTFQITVTPVNDAPSFTKGDDREVNEDAGPSSFAGWATGISAGPNESTQTVSFIIVSNNNPGLFSAGPAVSADGTLTFTSAANANGTAIITLKARDDGGTDDGGVNESPTQSFTIKVNPVNDAPSFTKQNGDKTVNEGASAQSFPNWASGMSAGPADESGQTLAFTVTNSNNALFSVQPAVSASGELTFTPSAGPNGTATVTVRLSDNGGTANGGVDYSEQTFNITVSNVPPTILTLLLPVSPVQVGTQVNLSATFSDPGTADVHTAAIDWEDGTSSGSVTEATQSVSGSHIYNVPGIYTVTLTVSDGVDSDTEAFMYVVVYDPSAGFVTGGGWIISPPGAYAADPTLTGKATFGFVSKYIFQKDKTTPVLSGNTEFQFHAGNLNFSSTSYQWLVVSGTSKATYKGSGTVNGVPGYGFLLSAIDGSPDRFRIKIWQTGGTVIYDNLIGGGVDEADPTTSISGGSIVLHIPKKTT
jgi:uncharacterized repeat protein (TIGR01451 family)